MIYKNLTRRKARTILTVVSIGIGVAAIISLGAMANGFEKGYSAMLSGSKADLILSQPDAYDISTSSIDESLTPQLATMPEVAEVSGMLEGYSQTENEPYFFVFGYPPDSFVMQRFRMTKGISFTDRQVRMMRGRPVILGSAAAEVLKKEPGDSLRLSGSVFRIIGIYETGDALEDSGAILFLEDAQTLLGKARQVSLYYIKLKDPQQKDRFIQRVSKFWPDLSLTGVAEYADKQSMGDYMQAYVWVISGLAIVIGGVGMMNAQLMSIYERTREIGVLRAMGWSKYRILWMIFGESLLVCLAAGVFGSLLGYTLVMLLTRITVMFGLSTSNITVGLFIEGFVVVIILGLVGGLYPAWKASRLQPVEALRYEGGSSGSKIRRLPFGGMTIQSLWQRSTRTILTLGAIGITVGGIMAMEAVLRGAFATMSDMFLGSQAEIMIRQANIGDTSFSAIDERIADKIAAMPEVAAVSSEVMTAVVMPKLAFFLVQGYSPSEFGIQRIKIVEGSPLTTNHQVIVGKIVAEALNKKPGDTLELSGTRFRIVGLYESNVGWEQMGGIVTLRDAQILTGKPRKATLIAVKLMDPQLADKIVERINTEFPEAYATLSGDFTEQMPDMKSSQGFLNAMSFLAILVGGLSVLNTMLMAVLERTREIGVLRALGWRKRIVLNMIIKESFMLGIGGACVGILLAILLGTLLGNTPMWGSALTPKWDLDIFLRAISLAVILGLVGGIYPAYRAARMQPVEAIRYE